MGEETDEVINPDSADLEAAQIRSEIEQTRTQMSTTIGALEEKLDPARIAEQVKEQIKDRAAEAIDSAKQSVRDATIGRAERLVSNVTEAVSEYSDRASSAMRRSSVGQYIADNPTPFLLIGAGLTWLLWHSRQSNQGAYSSSYTNYRSRPYEGSQYGRNPYRSGDREGAYRQTDYGRNDFGRSDYGRNDYGADEGSWTDRASDMASNAADSVRSAATTVRDKASDLAETAKEQARYGANVASEQAQTIFQDNPLALGVAVMAAGAILGLSVPSTDVENEYLGEARDRVVDRAKSAAKETADKLQHVTEQAGRTIKDSAQREGLISDTGSTSQPQPPTYSNTL